MQSTATIWPASPSSGRTTPASSWGASFLQGPCQGTGSWHADLVHEFQPAGITHSHNDTIPDVGGDTAWASGYAAYDKLSPAFQKFLDGKNAIFRSAHQYLDRENPLSGPKYYREGASARENTPCHRVEVLVCQQRQNVADCGVGAGRVRSCFGSTCSMYEKNLDIQVRWNWKSKENYGTSAIWDNRIAIHNAVWDHEGKSPRHGTRVTSLAEVPYFDPSSKSQREALGLDG
ncbi:hypothetical protein JCM33374_g5122 [Metschnikowia sp. JCM 33374]|nr:hypothetical protein JCM33374_g5122 [Metschnikowia sp. JCM 33374]